MVLKEKYVSVDDLSIEFEIQTRSIFGRKESSSVIALQDVSIQLSQGEVVALLGKNGAGKSTLLRAICGQIRPASGKIVTNGRVIILSGADPGFTPNLSGKRNIIELAKAYGIEDKEIQVFYEEVVDFANIGDAIHRDVRGYSTGMKGKLGFGFITGLQPEILLIDETLGVGDMEFRAKAQVRLKEFVRRSGSVIISTHSVGLAREICNRGLVLETGKVAYDGNISEAIEAYREG